MMKISLLHTYKDALTRAGIVFTPQRGRQLRACDVLLLAREEYSTRKMGDISPWLLRQRKAWPTFLGVTLAPNPSKDRQIQISVVPPR